MELLPPISPVWLDVITGRREVSLEFLAARMLVMRLRLSLQSDASPANASRCRNEMHRLYAENLEVGSAKHDLAKLGALR